MISYKEDKDLRNIIDDLMEKVVNSKENNDGKRASTTKLHKFSNPFMLKNSLNNSTVSTTASDENNSCERSNSDIGYKDRSSDSFVEENGISISERVANNNNLLRSNWNPEQSPNHLICKDKKIQHACENPFSIVEELHEDLNYQPNNVKKSVPIKYKTEIWRNWENEGFCRFGDECIFAHGSQELNRKVTVASNYKTKICKQFTEHPFYCPYGEKWQFLHLPYNPSDLSSIKTVKYSTILAETLKYIDTKIVNLSFLDDSENQGSLFKNSRLKIFKNMTDNWKESDDEPDETETLMDTSLATSAKKTALNKMSREFYLPSSKASKPLIKHQPKKKSKRSTQKLVNTGF